MGRLLFSRMGGRRGVRRAFLGGAAALAVLALSFWGIHTAYGYFMKRAYPREYARWVESYAKEYDFSPSLIYALIYTESRFQPDAVSSAGARGLMQITENTFLWAQMRSPEKESIGTDQLFDPETNIRYGVMTLSLLRERYKDTGTLLAAYNAGIGNVGKWLKDTAYSDDGVTLKAIPFEETRQYVKKIPKVQKIYQKLYDME